MGIRFNPFTGQLYDDQSTGQKGDQGNPGDQGDGFTGGTYDANTGIVTFTSNDGIGFTTGDLRGAAGNDGNDGTDGAPGTGLQIDAQVADTAARNAYSASEGDQVQQSDNGHVYLYRNSAWVDLGGLSGPQGNPGNDGAGFTGGTYENSTGVVTFTSDDGIGFTTSDIRGTPGVNGTGFTGGSYDSNTGIITFTSDDNLGFSTTDVRGAQGVQGNVGPSYDASVDYTTWATSGTGTVQITWDWSSSNFWKWNPATGDSFQFTFSNVPSNYNFAIQVLILTQHPASITWPTSIIWAQNTPPTLTAGKTSLITLSTCDGGTNIYGTFIEEV